MMLWTSQFSGVGVGNFGKSEIGNFGKEGVGVGYFTSGSAALLHSAAHLRPVQIYVRQT